MNRKLWKSLLCGLLAALMVAMPVSALAEHQHTYDNGAYEYETDYENPSYSADGEYAHAVTYDIYAYPVCDTCGERGSGHPDDCEQDYEDHVFQNGVCTKCGYECQHPDWWEGICNVCGTEHTDHVYDIEICDWTEDEDRAEYEPWDENSHYVYRWVRYSYCDVCGKRSEEGELDKSQWDCENHDFQDGICVQCGYQCEHPWYDEGVCGMCGEECDHSSTRTYIDREGKKGTAKEIPGDDYEHQAMVTYTRVVECEKCGTVLNTEKVDEITEEIYHNYPAPDEGTPGVCTECGHKCSHADTYEWSYISWDEELGEREYEEKENDDKVHYVTGIEVTYTECTICYKELEYKRSAERVTREEEHNYGWDDDKNAYVCWQCGHVSACKHEHLEDESEEYTIETRDIGDNACHMATIQKEGSWYCLDCGRWVDGSEPTRFERQESHNYNANGVCRECGHKNTCEHKMGSYYTSLQESKATYTPYSASQHKVVGEKMREFYCPTCDFWSVTPVGTTLKGYQPHYFENGVCALCGYKNTCKHEHTEVYEYLSSDNITEITPFDNTYHTVEGQKTTAVWCLDCGAELKHEPGGSIKEKWTHSYDENGVCTLCGHVNTCEHKNIKTEKEMPGYFILGDGSSKGHLCVGALCEITRCADCGMQLDIKLLDDDYSERRKHNFVNDRCTACGYQKTKAASADGTAQEAAALPNMALVYEPVSSDTAVNGVKASDSLPMIDALDQIGQALEDEDVTIEIPGIEKVLSREEMYLFNSLSIRDRLMVALSVLGFREILEQNPDLVSIDAQFLIESISSRMDNMAGDDLAALMKLLSELFVRDEVEVDGQLYTCYCIDLVITDARGKKTYQRYSFRQDKEDQWMLARIDIGEYQIVD